MFTILRNHFLKWQRQKTPFQADEFENGDEMVAHSIANHVDTRMEMAFRVGEVSDVGQWFTQ